MRITDMITQDEFAWYFINFSPLLLLEMNRGIKWELEFWSYGLTGFKRSGEPCKCEKKVGLARRVTRLAACSHFCEGRVTFLADPTFLHTNSLAHPAGSTRSRRDNQRMCERSWLGQRRQLLFPFTQLESDHLFRDNFSSYERGLKGWDKTTV